MLKLRACHSTNISMLLASIACVIDLAFASLVLVLLHGPNRHAV